MLRNNLSVLLAQRNLKITKVSEDTGISRTTLTALNTNSSQGIQFDTLNKLCLYLRITPDDFFSYLPYDINVRVEKAENEAYNFLVTLFFEGKPGIASFALFAFTEFLYELQFDLKENNKVFTASKNGVSENDKISRINIHIALDPVPSEKILESTTKESILTNNYFAKMPFIFKQYIEGEIVSQIVAFLENQDAVSKNVFVDFSWPDALA